jgi:hypothetical protein
MLSLRESFEAGFYPTQIGNYFNIVELFARYGSYPLDNLKSFIEKQTGFLHDKRGPAVMHFVQVVHELAEKSEILPPEPPQIPSEYFEWTEYLSANFHQQLGSDSPAAIAHSIGLLSGNILCQFNVLMNAMMLLLHDPQSQAFQLQVKALKDEIFKGKMRLSTQTIHPNAASQFLALDKHYSQTIDELKALDWQSLEQPKIITSAQSVQNLIQQLTQSVGKVIDEL